MFRVRRKQKNSSVPDGTLLARWRAISQTPYCLVCHFSVPVHSPYSLKSRGGSQINMTTEAPFVPQ